MPEEEKPNFTVVDRRAAQAEPTDAGTPAEPAAAAPSEADTAPDSAGTHFDMPESNGGDADGGDTDGGDTGAAPGEGNRTLPDPTFLLSMAAMQTDTRGLMNGLLPIFGEQAQMALGLIASPLTGQTETNYAAQLAIDCVHFLLTKLDSGLSDSDRRESQRRLADLRMNYVARVRAS